MNFFKKLLNAVTSNIKERKELNKTLRGLFEYRKKPKSITRGPASPFSISPGDILAFTYGKDKKYRLFIVMSIKRGPGKFISTRGKLLISGFRLNGYRDSTGFLLKTLYKNRLNSDYWKIKKLYPMVFGLENFRTYWIKQMHDFKEIHY